MKQSTGQYPVVSGEEMSGVDFRRNIYNTIDIRTRGRKNVRIDKATAKDKGAIQWEPGISGLELRGKNV